MLTPSPPEPPEGASYPRRLPRQVRSRITVDAILEATAQLLVARGYEEMTVVGVADRAGVSVGSLYQYFPDKAALVGGVMEAHLAREAEAIAAAFGHAAALPFGDAVEALVRAYVGVNAEDPGRAAALVAAAPEIAWSGGIEDLAHQSARSVHALLVERAGETRVDDLEAAAYVIATAVYSVVHLGVSQQPALLASGRLADEVVDLARRYLVADVPAASPGSSGERGPARSPGRSGSTATT